MTTLDIVTTLLLGVYAIAMFASAVEIIIYVIKEMRDE